MTRLASSRTFVGRRAELTQLDEAFGRALRGQPSLVLMAGEAGVGKSRLVAEFLAAIDSAAGWSAVGGCLDLGDGGLPYGPFVEALRSLARQIDLQARRNVFGPSVGILADLIPELRGDDDPVQSRQESVDWVAQRARMFDSALEVLSRGARNRPLVLVLEDLHWADGSTRDLLRFLVRNLLDERLLIVATYRSDELHRRHPLLALLSELTRAEPVERMELERFDRAQLAELLAGILGQAPTDDVVDVLFDRSDGLPFYAEELVARMDESSSALPPSLRDVLGQRLATLTPMTLALVHAASVIGGPIPHERLANLLDVTGDDLVKSVVEAIDARILVSVDGETTAYAFRHALSREAAYEALLPAERVRLHARLADSLEEALRLTAKPDPSLIADFALHASRSLDQPRALKASVRAARAYVDAIAYPEALRQAERALELFPRVDAASTLAGIDHADLLAMACRMAGAANRQDQAIALARSALTELTEPADAQKRAELLAALYFYAWEAENPDVAAAAIEEARRLVADADPSQTKAAVLLWSGWQCSDENRVRDALRHFEAAMAMNLTIGDRAAWADATACAARAMSDLGMVSVAGARVDESLSFVGDRDGRLDRVLSDIDRSLVMFLAGRFGEAIEIAATGLAQATRHGWELRLGPGLRGCLADALLELGRYDDVELTLARTLASHTIHHHRVWAARDLARVAIVRGRLDEAHRLLVGAGPDGSRWATDAWGAIPVAELARAEGRYEDVVRVIQRAIDGAADDEGIVPMPLLLGVGIAACADRAVVARRRRKPATDVTEASAQATRWLDLFRSYVRRVEGSGNIGRFMSAILTGAEAEMTRLQGSSDPVAWQEAVDGWVALAQPHQTAYSRLRLAEANLTGSGDRALAIEALHLAHATVAILGAKRLEGEIEQLAEQAQVRLDGANKETPATPALPQLTARERVVMRLVSLGHTNREIGQQLFISEKTASVHVSNAMRKLGALSRYEAAASAKELGLL